MRTCGNCGWFKRVGKRTEKTNHVFCGALPVLNARRVEEATACAFWKPRKDWREETCGTCEFRDERRGCRVAQPQEDDGYGYPKVEAPHPACAKWMPREDE